jgi:peptidyl-prolyl cis-trans isomerase C
MQRSDIGRHTVLVALLAAVVTSRPSAQDGHVLTAALSKVVATVGSKQIVVADVRDELVAERTRDLAQNRLDSYTSKAPELALQRLVDIKLLAAEATDRRLDRAPDVKRRLDDLIDESLAGVLIADMVKTLPLDEKALRDYYQTHLAEFTPPGRRRARHIVVKTEGEARALAQQVAQGADVGELAKSHNIDSTRQNGGDLGWIGRGVMVPAFEQALFALKVGETSPVVQTMFGFHLVQLQEIEQAKPPEFDKVRDAVKQKLLENRLTAFKDQLRAKYSIRVNKDALAEVNR